MPSITFSPVPLQKANRRSAPSPAAIAFATVLAWLPAMGHAQVTLLSDDSSLTGGNDDFANLALGDYVSFTRSLGPVGYTASQLHAGSDARLVRTTPASYGPGFAWYDNLVFASGIDGIRLDFSQPVNAFGAGAIGNITGGYLMTLRFFSAGTLLGSVGAGGVAGFQGNTGVTFVGGQSVVPFDQVEVLGPNFGFALNGMAIGAVAAVPEPAAALLLTLGLAVFGWRQLGAARR